ncbi:dienelactone hydrolase family protein [Dictyobacter formicarum]|uniref:Carboxymethylenebutenolidase n=1 Tax=Dictyobacter formicarum TaxID=2778368 RepID=A0ABQ3VAS2_9CHLR|nr:dienelactone hydrolase family protein [Dictyobacter formicarum]GHO82791.1 carboxymethylenebutenolidase [Dictyobacter formicarum]
MCYDDNARPPLPPIEGGSAHGEDIVLTAADGNRFAAYSAYPDKSLGAQVIIYPDVRGLHQFYKELALRFAETGIRAVAIDYFGRTAGLTSRDDSFDFWPHVQQLHLASFFSDVKAAQDHLHSSQGSNLPTFPVGFCLGGTLALLSGTQDFGFAGLIGFYAGMSRNIDGEGTALDRAEEIKYPVLGLFGGADQGIPTDQVQTLEQKLEGAGIEHEIVTYPGAPHSFFDRRATDFAEASIDAWNRVLRFISAHTSR